MNPLAKRSSAKRLRDELAVIAALNGYMPNAWRFVYPELSKATGLRTARLYPALHRLTEHGIVEDKLIDQQDGKPPRRAYRLTAEHRRSLT